MDGVSLLLSVLSNQWALMIGSMRGSRATVPLASYRPQPSVSIHCVMSAKGLATLFSQSGRMIWGITVSDRARYRARYRY